jgi:hypothetical protein
LSKIPPEFTTKLVPFRLRWFPVAEFNLKVPPLVTVNGPVTVNAPVRFEVTAALMVTSAGLPKVVVGKGVVVVPLNIYFTPAGRVTLPPAAAVPVPEKLWKEPDAVDPPMPAVLAVIKVAPLVNTTCGLVVPAAMILFVCMFRTAPDATEKVDDGLVFAPKVRLEFI